MKIIQKIANHTSQYFVGEVLILAASFISFPIFTRILSLAEYGAMNIVSMTIDLFVLFSNAGLRPALFRFFGHYEQDSKEKANQLFITLFFATVILALFSICILNLICWLPIEAWIAADLLQLMRFSAFLILFRTASELILALFRIKEQATFFLIGHVARKYAGLVLAIYFVVVAEQRLEGLFRGLLIGEGTVFLGLVGYILFSYRQQFFQFSGKIFMDCARYGVPLIGQNFSAFINSVGDRYLIEFMKGSVAVGIYSTGYNLARYIQALIVDTLEAAMIPLTMNVFAKSGKEETQKLLSIYFSVYVLIAMPLVWGLFAVAKSAVVIVASDKYLPSVEFVGPLIVGIMVAGAFFPATVGLHIQKKTTTIAKIMFYTAMLNVLLNLFMIPLWGIWGAVIATIISCLFQIVYGLLKSGKYLKVAHNVKFYFVCLISAVLMYFVLRVFNIETQPSIWGLIGKIIVGVLAYVAAVFGFDFLILRKARMFSRENLAMLTSNKDE